MKKGTILPALVTAGLNLLWSLIFDLLPNIVDFSEIPNITVWHYVVFVIGLIFINAIAYVFSRRWLRKIWKRETFISQFSSAINVLIEEEAGKITDRRPKMRPGNPQVYLKYYNDALVRLNDGGSVELKLASSPKNFDPQLPLYLSNISPGMSKYFMILTQDREDPDPSFVRIMEEYDGNPEEFTFTWFDKIFPILGNLSEKISAKEMALSNQPESDGHFEIRDYEFSQREGDHFIKISVI